MILTVTLNTALGITYRVRSLRPDASHRVSEVRERPGVPVGAYAGLICAARVAEVPVLLDTGGEPLRRGIAARPDIVKPNSEQLAELTGSHEPLRATQDARRRGTRGLVASLSPDGLLAVTPESLWRATPPAHGPGNPTGAGDSAVAGLLAGLADDLPRPDRLTHAAALSAAMVAAPGAGEFERALHEGLVGRISVIRDET